MLHSDGGALLKNSGKIRNWVRWSDTADIRLRDIDFFVWVRLQNMGSMKVDDEEILVGKIIWGKKIVKAVS